MNLELLYHTAVLAGLIFALLTVLANVACFASLRDEVPSPDPPRVSILVPARNEAPTVGDIVRAARFASSHASSQSRVVGFFERRAMLPARAAARIVAGMKGNSSRVLITAEARLADMVKRLFPVLPSGVVAKAHAWVTRA